MTMIVFIPLYLSLSCFFHAGTSFFCFSFVDTAIKTKFFFSLEHMNRFFFLIRRAIYSVALSIRKKTWMYKYKKFDRYLRLTLRFH